MTLIAGVKTDGGEGDIFSKAESLAADISPITGVIERAACKDLYFQSVSFVVPEFGSWGRASRTYVRLPAERYPIESVAWIKVWNSNYLQRDNLWPMS